MRDGGSIWKELIRRRPYGGKRPLVWMEGEWSWVLMQAMCWGSGTGGPCAKGSDELRKRSLKKLLRLGWWDTLQEGLRVIGIRTLHT